MILEGIKILLVLQIQTILSTPSDSLIGLQILFRHGQENIPTSLVLPYLPSHQFVNDSTLEDEHYTLTKKGQRQMHNLGQSLSHRYGDIFKEEDISILSSSQHLSRSSALDFLTGFLHQKESFLGNHQLWFDQGFNFSFKYLPLNTDDTFLVSQKYCQKYKELCKQEMENNLHFRQFFGKFRTTMFQTLGHYPTQQGGYCIDPPAISVALDLQYFISENKGAEPEVLKSLREMLNEQYSYYMSTKAMSRLRAGGMVHRFLSKMNSDLNSSSVGGPKVGIYSGYDTTLANWLIALNAIDNKRPPYASAVIMELHKSDGENNTYEVKIFYKNQTDSEEYYRIHLPKCPAPCEPWRFTESLKELIYPDPKIECSMSNFLKDLNLHVSVPDIKFEMEPVFKSKPTPWSSILKLVSFICLLVAVVIRGCKYLNRDQDTV